MSELLAYQRAGKTDVCVTYRARFYGDDEVAMALRLSAVDLEKPIPAALFEYKEPPKTRIEDLDGSAPEEVPSVPKVDEPK